MVVDRIQMKETNHGCNRAGAALRRPCLTNPSNGETAVPCFVGLAGSKGPDTVFSETDLTGVSWTRLE